MKFDFLLVNPWIYDFAAYDFWLKPYGLLFIGGKLRKLGYTIYYLDLLDPFYPELPRKPKRKIFGTGHFYKELFPKPSYFQDVPRRFYRYGLPVNIVKKLLSSIKFKAILITCTLTYWYPGLVALLELLTALYPEAPIYIGGIYAKLCYTHLKNLLNELFSEYPVFIVTEHYESFLRYLQNTYTPSGKPYEYEYPIFYMQKKLSYVVIMTSLGCPFNCPYCASKKLYPVFEPRNPEEVFKEILFWHERYKVVDFAFYDDALLFNFEKHLGIILDKVIKNKLNIRFHTPNAIHARFINKKVAQLLKKAGFKTIRIGLERVENRFDNKVSIEEFLQAIAYLREAGFKEKELGAYFLYGIPEEDFDEVKRGLKFLAEVRVPPYLAEFSPIPGTPFFEKAKLTSRYPIEDDPIFQNNTVFPALKKPDWEKIKEVKNLAKDIRHFLCN